MRMDTKLKTTSAQEKIEGCKSASYKTLGWWIVIHLKGRRIQAMRQVFENRIQVLSGLPNFLLGRNKLSEKRFRWM
jgi:hypothetical protein